MLLLFQLGHAMFAECIQYLPGNFSLLRCVVVDSVSILRPAIISNLIEHIFAKIQPIHGDMYKLTV